MLALEHVWGIIIHPKQEWKRIYSDKKTNSRYYSLLNLALLAMIPGICSYIGSVNYGWSALGTDPIKISPSSALMLALSSWVTIIAGVVIIGFLIQWVANIYKCKKSRLDCVYFSIYVAIPLCFIGISGVYPSVLLSIMSIIIGLAWSTYLLYIGLPIFMHISSSKGFLFSTAIVCIALVLLVVLKVATVLLWEAGFEPEFIDHFDF